MHGEKKSGEFDVSQADTQATDVNPIAANEYDLEAYEEYESRLLGKCKDFQKSDSGVLVYRRVRVREVFSYGCRDMKHSLEMQLGALKKSLEYKGDVPNFLEPWYGIGTVASSFGIDYVWHKGQAPAFAPKFKSIRDALKAPSIPVKETPIGQHTLNMIDYFLEQTRTRIPISLCDIQSPLNVACQIVDMASLFMGLYDCPDQFIALLDRISMLLSEFIHEQIKSIGDALVWPGHGFGSSRVFQGLGMSDDNSLMLSADQYQKFAVPSMVKAALDFRGPVYHSCGNWSHLAPTVRQIPGLKMVDGAFSIQTDPSPNDAEIFPDVFADSGIVVNARIVGDYAELAKQVSRLWKSGMKLIVVTYCQTLEEQNRVYDLIHEICV